MWTIADNQMSLLFHFKDQFCLLESFSCFAQDLLIVSQCHDLVPRRSQLAAGGHRGQFLVHGGPLRAVLVLAHPAAVPEPSHLHVPEDERRRGDSDWLHAHAAVRDHDAAVGQTLGQLGCVVPANAVQGQGRAGEFAVTKCCGFPEGRIEMKIAGSYITKSIQLSKLSVELCLLYRITST